MITKKIDRNILDEADPNAYNISETRISLRVIEHLVLEDKKRLGKNGASIIFNNTTKEYRKETKENKEIDNMFATRRTSKSSGDIMSFKYLFEIEQVK